MKVLGIETSCDETAAAVVEIDEQTQVCRLLSNTVVSQIDIHKAYGGVVPEVAARSHIEAIIPVIDEALREASQTKDDIDAIAVTYGAGLGGSLLVGVMTARSLAIALNKPLYAINHVEAHVYANFITETSPSLSSKFKLPASAPKFPILTLIVSGGHTQLVLFKDHFNYQILGKTQDDAIGEAFDKVAKMIGLPYPGGPSVAEKAKVGDAYAFNFPKAQVSGDFNFSFSGLKTAVLRTAQGLTGHNHTLSSTELPGLLSEAQKANIAASFQRIAIETIVDKTVLAYKQYLPASVIIAGGVAASDELRHQLASRLPVGIEYTDRKLCTDNAAMVATLGCFKVLLKTETADPYTLEIQPSLKMLAS